MRHVDVGGFMRSLLWFSARDVDDSGGQPALCHFIRSVLVDPNVLAHQLFEPDAPRHPRAEDRRDDLHPVTKRFLGHRGAVLGDTLWRLHGSEHHYCGQK